MAAGRVEIIGGAFYEPILTMIPSRDRLGQIRMYSQWLEGRLGGRVRGMWIPERVWEQALTSDVSAAGIQYTVLDDFHFRNAGLSEERLYGYYVTEDDGRTLSIFPGSERLRYLIPFRDPHETVDYLRGIAAQHPDAVAVFGDDGEKFGTWPGTHKHCYQDGWLKRFFDALSANRDWLKATTLSDAVDHVPPTGKIYLPDCSYREMTEWSLPVTQQLAYESAIHDLEHDQRWPRIKPFVRGGFWRNFKVKYPEANEMYSRMMMVSRRLEQAEQSGVKGDDFDWARRELYRGQCNCSYWHGAFGGIYLPHLRNAVYNHLIAADNLLDKATANGRRNGHVEAAVDDYNFDARQEVRLVNDKLFALLAPALGGQLYELDVRSICHNVLATLSRRPEAYHRKVLAGPSAGGDGCSSIHDRVVFKQVGLDRLLRYDRYPRKSLVDHFYDNDTPLAAVVTGDAMERGDFASGLYEAKLRKSPDRIQVLLAKQGNAWGIPLKITKGVTLGSSASALEIAYLVEGIPPEAQFHFGVEFNFAGMPAGADNRYYYDAEGSRLGQLGAELDLREAKTLGLVDEWLGLDILLELDRPSDVWAFPVGTVSQSESGIELVHQSVVVQPHWLIRGDANGRWSVVMRLSLDAGRAERRSGADAHGRRRRETATQADCGDGPNGPAVVLRRLKSDCRQLWTFLSDRFRDVPFCRPKRTQPPLCVALEFEVQPAAELFRGNLATRICYLLIDFRSAPLQRRLIEIQDPDRFRRGAVISLAGKHVPRFRVAEPGFAICVQRRDGDGIVLTSRVPAGCRPPLGSLGATIQHVAVVQSQFGVTVSRLDVFNVSVVLIHPDFAITTEITLLLQKGLLHGLLNRLRGASAFYPRSRFQPSHRFARCRRSRKQMGQTRSRLAFRLVRIEVLHRPTRATQRPARTPGPASRVLPGREGRCAVPVRPDWSPRWDRPAMADAGGSGRPRQSSSPSRNMAAVISVCNV